MKSFQVCGAQAPGWLCCGNAAMHANGQSRADRPARWMQSGAARARRRSFASHAQSVTSARLAANRLMNGWCMTDFCALSPPPAARRPKTSSTPHMLLLDGTVESAHGRSQQYRVRKMRSNYWWYKRGCSTTSTHLEPGAAWSPLWACFHASAQGPIVIDEVIASRIGRRQLQSRRRP